MPKGKLSGTSGIEALMHTQDKLMENQQMFLNMITNLCSTIKKTPEKYTEAYTLAFSCCTMVSIVENQHNAQKIMSTELSSQLLHPNRQLTPAGRPYAPTGNKVEQGKINDKTPHLVQGQEKQINTWCNVVQGSKKKALQKIPDKGDKEKKRMMLQKAVKTKVLSIKQDLRKDELTLKLIPVDESMRTSQLGFRSFATVFEAYIHKEITGLQSRHLDDVRRDGRGHFYVQFKERDWKMVADNWDLSTLKKQVHLGAFGK